MNHIYPIGVAFALFALYGIVGTLDMQDQERAEAHKAEIIAAAKARRAREIAWKKLEDDSEFMTFPIQAYERR